MCEEQVSGRWREYFEKLLNEENEWNDELSVEYVEGPADMMSKEEVRQAIQDLKVRKAAGPSGVTGEMITVTRGRLTSKLLFRFFLSETV